MNFNSLINMITDEYKNFIHSKFPSDPLPPQSDFPELLPALILLIVIVGSVLLFKLRKKTRPYAFVLGELLLIVFLALWTLPTGKIMEIDSSLRNSAAAQTDSTDVAVIFHAKDGVTVNPRR